ncbi:MAG: DUF2905 domain-containing protein [Stygiobacter sp.]|jgi:hypothetical protein|uniref:DUF2905 domain-containing protein n=1 Tax=Stygiobacter electus TaxID=3032292 RepID=A0AAE3NZW2_9BACT|nr:DUF2905 domain-containing protein [Stygiobacter electus]MDF1611675.1 DUF2905 domain-containing protein [Stygiobacter electus]
MNELQPFGKLLILSGLILLIVGLLFTFWDKLPLIGKLPGDIVWKGKNFTFYFPIVTSILLSIIISLILYFFRK